MCGGVVCLSAGAQFIDGRETSRRWRIGGEGSLRLLDMNLKRYVEMAMEELEQLDVMMKEEEAHTL
jgi:hypothetical protein